LQLIENISQINFVLLYLKKSSIPDSILESSKLLDLLAFSATANFRVLGPQYFANVNGHLPLTRMRGTPRFCQISQIQPASKYSTYGYVEADDRTASSIDRMHRQIFRRLPITAVTRVGPDII
jgi:hypothetical protein